MRGAARPDGHVAELPSRLLGDGVAGCPAEVATARALAGVQRDETLLSGRETLDAPAHAEDVGPRDRSWVTRTSDRAVSSGRVPGVGLDALPATRRGQELVPRAQFHAGSAERL